MVNFLLEKSQTSKNIDAVGACAYHSKVLSKKFYGPQKLCSTHSDFKISLGFEIEFEFRLSQ